MTPVSDAIERRNNAISAIKAKYLEKRNRLLLEMQWEIDEVETAYMREMRLAMHRVIAPQKEAA